MMIPKEYRSGTILPIVQAGQDILNMRTSETTITVDNFIEKYSSVAIDMLANSYILDAAGLAAPQVGKFMRMFVMTIHPSPNHPKSPVLEDTVVVNPVIQWHSERQATLVESCLSIPGFYAAVTRSESIMVQYLSFDLSSKDVMSVDQQRLSGFAARVFLHEYDHLNGILFPQRVTNWTLCATEENRPALLEKVEHM